MKRKNIKIATATLAAILAIPAIGAYQYVKSDGTGKGATLGGDIQAFDMTAAPEATSTDPAPLASTAAASPNTPQDAPEGTVYYEPIASEADFLSRFTVIDGNKDGREWEYVDFYKAPRVVTNDVKLDDWLITPGITLEANKSYKFTIDVRPGSDKYPMDTFEVMAGKSTDPKDMTITVIAPTKTQFIGFEGFAPYYTTYTGYLNTDAAGNYHIGMHAISDPGAYCFYARNFTLYEGVASAGPDQVTDFKAVPDKDGGLSATVSFKAPAVNTVGDSIKSISKIELYRGKTLINTFSNPAPGAELSITDKVDSVGDYTYAAKPFNDNGEGKEAVVETFIGVDYAAAPSSANVVETDEDGVVTISWDAVTTSESGGYINTSRIRYFVGIIMTDGSLLEVADNIKGTSYTYRAAEKGDQKLVQYAVASHTDRGYSQGTVTEPITAGTPTAVPWCESFPDASLNTVMGTKAIIGQCHWSISRDSSFQNMSSADGDNGYVSFWTTAPGDQGRLYTGKFRLDNIVNPAVTFYICKRTAGTPDIGTIEVEIKEGSSDFTTIATVKAETYPLKGWNKVVVPIPAKYKGKVINLGFKATRVTYTYQFLDKLQIEDLAEYNLAVNKLSGPSVADPGNAITLEGSVTNTGAKSAEGYSLVLRCNGWVVDEKQGATLATGEVASVSFNVTPNVSHGEEIEYTMEVNWDKDALDSDNKGVVQIPLRIKKYPAPDGLTAQQDDNGVALSWNAPELETETPGKVTDDFESYPSFENSAIGEWVLYDGDQGKVGGFHTAEGPEIVMPGIEMNSQQSWWVMDNTYESLKDLPSFDSHSGTKYLAQQYITGGKACDDWAISPEIYAGGQTISLYARSFDASDPESFEILYSKGSTNPGDFTLVKAIGSVPGVWTKYEFQIPAGAERFAIRCTSNYKAMLFIDDVEYIPMGNTGLKLKGYNIYRDNSLITPSPVTGVNFSDGSVQADREYIYHVSAVYDRGESKAHGPASVKTTAVAFIDADNGDTPRYFNLQGIEIAAPRKGEPAIMKSGNRTVKIIGK